MAIIGYKKVGWSKNKEKRKYELLVQFDREIERDLFERIIDTISELNDWAKIY